MEEFPLSFTRLVILGVGTTKTCKATEAARFICPSTKCIQPVIFHRFSTFRIKLNWGLQEQQYKKYSYFSDSFNLKSYGFSWTTSLLCSSCTRSFCIQTIWSWIFKQQYWGGKKTRKEKLPESPFPEHNSEKAFPAKDSSCETFQQVSLIWIHHGRFQSHTLKSKELKQVSSTVGEAHKCSLQPAVAQHLQQNPASLRAQTGTERRAWITAGTRQSVRVLLWGCTCLPLTLLLRCQQACKEEPSPAGNLEKPSQHDTLPSILAVHQSEHLNPLLFPSLPLTAKETLKIFWICPSFPFQLKASLENYHILNIDTIWTYGFVPP